MGNDHPGGDVEFKSRRGGGDGDGDGDKETSKWLVESALFLAKETKDMLDKTRPRSYPLDDENSDTEEEGKGAIAVVDERTQQFIRRRTVTWTVKKGPLKGIKFKGTSAGERANCAEARANARTAINNAYKAHRATVVKKKRAG